MGLWTCISGYSVDGTLSGAAFYEAQCGSSGLFLPFGQDCRDIDYCDGDPCGANGECSDCSTSACERGTSFLQRSSIVGGKQYEATDDYACETKVGTAGELTCSTDDCDGLDCGVGGTCYDLSVAEEGHAGEFSCHCHDRGLVE